MCLFAKYDISILLEPDITTLPLHALLSHNLYYVKLIISK